ncbi:cytochrome P450 2C18 [Microcaecilia unicolor]|uniref:Cytochrome P450 2C18-like n=1 Tax=Microcaecilia unicolor TaxID=1415580 RepID=A0A6P7Z559_9AMPH|nr:cytochrome P450 2C18-like [Microcaecilia unicolor]
MELREAAILLLVLCITCLLFSAWRWNLKSQNLHLPPGPLPVPFLGNSLHLMGKTLVQVFIELSKTYGPVCTFYMGSRRVVVLSGLETLKEATLNEGDVFNNRGSFPMLQLVMKDYGITLSNGERWKQMRRFSITTLRNYGMGKKSIEEQMQEEAQHLTEEFRKMIEVPFDPSLFFSQAIANVTSSMVFGIRFDYGDRRLLTLLKIVNENYRLHNSKWGQVLNTFPQILKYCPRAYPAFSRNFKQLKAFVLEQIHMHQETLDHSCPRDFVDCYLIKKDQEAANPQTEFCLDNLVAITIALYFAGTESVSSILRYGFLIFQKYPEILEKIHAEIDMVIGRDRSPRLEDRNRMPYTDAVIHETLRFADIFPTGIPHSVTKDVSFRGYTIPKGTTVYFLLTSVLNDTNLFENPETFRPEHFLDEKGSFKKSEAFIPFSTGKRSCLGEGLARMELFLFFTTILQNFTLKPTRDPKDINLVPEISGTGYIPPRYQFSILPR